MPGQGQQTLQRGQEARAIHEKLGAKVAIAMDTDGRMHYAATYEDWADWVKVGSRLQTSEQWQTFGRRIAANPTAEVEDHYMLRVVSPGGGGSTYQVFVWDPLPGRGGDLVTNSLIAKKIHEKAGADVGILLDQLGRMHYVVSFDSMEAWAKFADTPNPAFQTFMREQNEDPTGKLIKVYTATAP